MPVAFSVLMTMSCGPRSAGSAEAFTLALTLVSPTFSVSPLVLTASRCGPRITQDTSWPARASRTAKWLPTAPAPKMQIRMSGTILRNVPRQFPQARGIAQPVMRVARSRALESDGSRHLLSP
ncbi:hypothetical protein ABIF07_005952 [Bradyrhizobium elkanii]